MRLYTGDAEVQRYLMDGESQKNAANQGWKDVKDVKVVHVVAGHVKTKALTRFKEADTSLDFEEDGEYEVPICALGEHEAQYPYNMQPGQDLEQEYEFDEQSGQRVLKKSRNKQRAKYGYDLEPARDETEEVEGAASGAMSMRLAGKSRKKVRGGGFAYGLEAGADQEQEREQDGVAASGLQMFKPKAKKGGAGFSYGLEAGYDDQEEFETSGGAMGLKLAAAKKKTKAGMAYGLHVGTSNNEEVEVGVGLGRPKAYDNKPGATFQESLTDSMKRGLRMLIAPFKKTQLKDSEWLQEQEQEGTGECATHAHCMLHRDIRTAASLSGHFERSTLTMCYCMSGFFASLAMNVQPYNWQRKVRQMGSADFSNDVQFVKWLSCTDPVSGKTYYWNQLTRETRWELPS